ncbi:hypothetical protein [Deinococcus radiodurans]|uniref:hypothetical protein n=1 Tax=Deinococcus radiodurans TaxID=1299 RepID=UPI001F1D4B7C|nr:hypothetical protein [Deinococcus radiodurans]
MDETIIQPAVHSAVGGIALLVALITTVLTWLGARRAPSARRRQRRSSCCKLR